MKVIVFLCFFSFSLAGLAQGVVVGQELEQTSSVLKQANQLPVEGTYQIEVESESVIVEVTDAVLKQVNYKRHAKDVVYIVVNDYVRIKILPFSVIRSKDFKPVKKYSYEE